MKFLFQKYGADVKLAPEKGEDRWSHPHQD